MVQESLTQAHAVMPKRVATTQKTVMYGDLMNAFQTLAADVAKRPELSEMFHGFIINARTIISDSTSSQVKHKMLSLFTDTTNTLANRDTHTCLSLKGNCNESSDIPIVRPAAQGRTNTLRLKSVQEINQPKKKAGDKRPCSYCSIVGHRADGGCEARKTLGILIPEKEIDQLKHDIMTRVHHRFGTISIPKDAPTLNQVPLQTNYVCIHGYATHQSPNNQDFSQSTREDMNFLCVSLVYKHAVILKEYNKCYVRSSVITDWIAKNKTHRKHVVEGSL